MRETINEYLNTRCDEITYDKVIDERLEFLAQFSSHCSNMHSETPPLPPGFLRVLLAMLQYRYLMALVGGVFQQLRVVVL